MSVVPMIIGSVASLAGAGINAYQQSKANKIAEEGYNNQRGALLTELYANPLDSVANKSLLSQMDKRLNKQEAAIQNHAAAGGATFENVLAAKQASNDAMSDVVSGIMQGEQARQDSLKQQILSLDSNRTQQRINQKLAAGQNWQNMLNGLAGSLNSLGGTMMETGTSMSELFKFK